MKLILSAGGAVALILVAGCAQFEADAKAGIRNQIVTACKTQGDVYKAQVPNLDVDRFCGCMGDKFIEGKSVEQIRNFQSDKAGQERAGAQAGMECFAQVGAAMPATAQSVPAPTAAPAAPVPASSAPEPEPDEEAPAEDSGEE